MQAPLADREVIGAGTSVETIQPPQDSGVTGSPGVTDPTEKHFERNGWDVVEVKASEIPTLSNEHTDTAFCVVEGDELNGTIKASDPIAVFTRGGETIGLGDHFDGGAKLMQLEDRADGSEMRNIGVDARQDGRGAKWVINKGCELRDVTVQGEQDGAGKWAAGVYIGGLSGDEEVTLRNLDLSGGASRAPDIPSHHDSIGVILGGSCDGVLRMDGCTIGGYPNNGVYASGPTKQGNDGFAIIKDHTGFNSDRDQIRVGGKSKIINPTLYVDESKPGFDNHRGIWFRYARGAVVRRGSIKTFAGSDPGSAIRIDSSAGAVDVIDVDVELRGSHHAARGIEAHSPDDDARDAGAAVKVRGGRFHGSGSPRDVILIQSGRDGSSVENVDIDVPHAQQEIDIR